MRYLSPVEEGLVANYMNLGKAELPDENDELLDFLEWFICRSQVSSENLRKEIVEIANQELIRKPHFMIATWQHVVQKLKKYPEFQTIPGIEGFYDSINPTDKNVLDTLESQPHTEAERDDDFSSDTYEN